MQEVNTKKPYNEFKKELDTEMRRSVESFVRIGYLLKVARDTEVLYESGYQTVAEFAAAEYNLSKDQVSRFIAINDKYSIDGYSERLQDRYEGFGVAKLAEMLTLPEAVADIISPEMTRAEIQEIKKEVNEERSITDIEVMLEEQNKNMEDMSMLQKFMYQYFYENRNEFIEMAAVFDGGMDLQREIEGTLNVLAPSGIATKKVRIAGVGKLFLSVKGKEQNLELVNMRSNEKEEISWEMFLDDICELYQDGASKEVWELYYKELFEEERKEEIEKVAPVQRKEEQIPEQVIKDDYEGIVPSGEWMSIYCVGDIISDMRNDKIAKIIEKQTDKGQWKVQTQDSEQYIIHETDFVRSGIEFVDNNVDNVQKKEYKTPEIVEITNFCDDLEGKGKENEEKPSEKPAESIDFTRNCDDLAGEDQKEGTEVAESTDFTRNCEISNEENELKKILHEKVEKLDDSLQNLEISKAFETISEITALTETLESMIFTRNCDDLEGRE